MPIYEYECKSCNKIIEVIQRISDEPLVSCPTCSGSIRKMVSMSAFHLKGGGWYADGYSTAVAANGKVSGNGGKTASSASSGNGGKAGDAAAGPVKKESTSAANSSTSSSSSTSAS